MKRLLMVNIILFLKKAPTIGQRRSSAKQLTLMNNVNGANSFANVLQGFI